MGRALSFSLLAHALFALTFLLLSATRQPLPVVPAARPVRLVTYLEPAPAPRDRAGAAAARSVPAPPAAAGEPVAPAPPPSPAPLVVPRVVIPAPAPDATARASRAAPAPAASGSALAERLTRRLAAAAPAGAAAPAASAPRIASLPPIDATAEPPVAVPAPQAPGPSGPSGPSGQGAPAGPRGAVEPVGYFPHAWYLALLKEELFARWSPPSEYFRSGRPPVALVSFRITRSGTLEAVALKQASGSARFDQSALAAVRSLGAVPALPGQYAEETLDVIIRFQNEE